MSGLALTFDDGPDVVWTPRLLDLLADAGVCATFFPIATRARNRPNLIERMLSEGHAVGLHCHQHIRHLERDAAWLRRDTGTALATLARLGADPVYWRAPWGESAPWTAQVAREHGLRVIRWDVDSHDWRGDGAEAMFASTHHALRDGAVVLSHDGIGPGARRSGALETLRYTELVIAHAQARGLRLTALHALEPR